MICKKCGHVNDKDILICKNCGTNLVLEYYDDYKEGELRTKEEIRDRKKQNKDSKDNKNKTVNKTINKSN